MIGEGERGPRCPACGSGLTMAVPDGILPRPTAYSACIACEALWETVPATWAEAGFGAEPCDNCAFRPGSPEQADPEGWRQLLDQLRPGAENPGRFYCHKGLPITHATTSGRFEMPMRPASAAPPFDTLMVPDPARMTLCRGYLRMRATLAAKGDDDAQSHAPARGGRGPARPGHRRPGGPEN